MNPAVPNFSMIRERADKAEGGVLRSRVRDDDPPPVTLRGAELIFKFRHTSQRLFGRVEYGLFRINTGRCSVFWESD